MAREQKQNWIKTMEGLYLDYFKNNYKIGYLPNGDSASVGYLITAIY